MLCILCELIHCHFPSCSTAPQRNVVAQSLDTQALRNKLWSSRREGVGVTHQRKVGIGLLGACLETREHIGDVDGKKNLPTQRSPLSNPPHSPPFLFSSNPLFLYPPLPRSQRPLTAQQWPRTTTRRTSWRPLPRAARRASGTNDPAT